MKKFVLVGTMASALVLAGCQMTKETERILAQAAGGLTGLVAGSLLGDGVGRYIAMGVGSAAGAWLAGELFDALSAEDKQMAVESLHQSAETGQTVTWHNPETNVSGSTSVKETSFSTEQVALPVLKDRITEVPPLDLIGEDYRARSGSNVRGGPGTDFVVVDSLSAGQTVEVVGKVQGTNWVMIAQDGIGSGFVRQDLLAKAPAQTAEQRAEVIRHRAASQKKAESQGLIQEVSVSSTSECREMVTQVNMDDGSTQAQTVKACRGPSGWQMV